MYKLSDEELVEVMKKNKYLGLFLTESDAHNKYLSAVGEQEGVKP